MKLILVFLLTFSGFSTLQAQCDINVREAFGGVSSIMIYNTYITIGAIGDAHEKGVYDAEYVKGLMGEQTSMLQTAIDLLAKCKEVKSNGLEAGDIDYIKGLIKCLESLKGEAQGLSDYVISKSEDALLTYNTNRKKAWDQIATLMGLE